MKKNLTVFISYKWESQSHVNWVEKIATDLRRNGIEAILDKWYVDYGDSFIDYMTNKIGSADVVLFIMTKKSVESVEKTEGGGAVKFEMQLAKSRNIAGDKMRLIGVLREKGAVPLHLKDRRYADFTNDDEYEMCLNNLVKDLLGIRNIPPVQGTVISKSVNLHDPQEIFKNSLGMHFVLIHPGIFLMGNGSSVTDLVKKYGGHADNYAGEFPSHEVTISNAFYLQNTPVTQGQWITVMGTNISYFNKCGPECPVDNVSWHDAKKFISRLNEIDKEGKYRLPTEAEWEYACRAGTETEFSFGNNADDLNEFAWYLEEGKRRPYPVANKNPNPWGLYDIHGNIWEWVEDCWHETYFGAPIDGSARQATDERTFRVFRGGCFRSDKRECRSSSRGRNSPYHGSQLFGFRVAKSIKMPNKSN